MTVGAVPRVSHQGGGWAPGRVRFAARAGGGPANRAADRGRCVYCAYGRSDARLFLAIPVFIGNDIFWQSISVAHHQ